MKLVKENINFERGLDPKMAMGIGNKSELIKSLDNWVLKIDNIINHHTELIEQYQKLNDINPKFKMTFAIRQMKRKLSKLIKNKEKIERSREKLFLKESRRRQTNSLHIFFGKGNVYRKHPNQYAQQELRSNSHAFNKGKPEKMAMPNDLQGAEDFIIKHYFKRKAKFVSVSESINFERGLDPKVAMNTGDLVKRNLDNVYRSMCNIAAEFGVSKDKVIRDDQAYLSAFNFKGFAYVLGYNPKGNSEFDPNTMTSAEFEYSISYEELPDDKTRNKRLEYEQEEYDTFDEAKEALREWLYNREQENSANESVNFKRGLEPKDAMGIGNVKKRESDRILKEMRRYMRAAMKASAPVQKLKSKDYCPTTPRHNPDLCYKSYYFKIDKYQFQLKYYYNRPLWDLELNYGGMKRYITLKLFTIKDFVHEVHLAMQDLDLK